MNITMLKCKIHRATVTEAQLDYVGSITIDETLIKASGLLEYEKVQIVDCNNGERFETYVIAGPANSGVICLNGAAARKVAVQDKIIIMAYGILTSKEAATHRPQVILVDEENKITKTCHYERHGVLG
ncbi:aspartate 1-decarboxylase [Enterococcus asini]|uniref:aspartate 1-decarboxylase n=1 Tax=Enterococcus TaxID=1350 RepID=UPI00288F9CFC|nr:aspartate 1-decarboxylase [Enterococcus asini]MDT2757877.1 aspartate 1-decarboxylase [Enterococcus asini]